MFADRREDLVSKIPRLQLGKKDKVNGEDPETKSECLPVAGKNLVSESSGEKSNKQRKNY